MKKMRRKELKILFLKFCRLLIFERRKSPTFYKRPPSIKRPPPPPARINEPPIKIEKFNKRPKRLIKVDSLS